MGNGQRTVVVGGMSTSAMPLQCPSMRSGTEASTRGLRLGDWRGSEECGYSPQAVGEQSSNGPSHIDAALQIRVVMFMRVRSGQEPDTRRLSPLHLRLHPRLAAPWPLTPAARPGPQAFLLSPPQWQRRSHALSRRTITLVRAQRPNQPPRPPSTNGPRTLSICHTTCITCVS